MTMKRVQTNGPAKMLAYIDGESTQEIDAGCTGEVIMVSNSGFDYLVCFDDPTHQGRPVSLSTGWVCEEMLTFGVME